MLRSVDARRREVLPLFILIIILFSCRVRGSRNLHSRWASERRALRDAVRRPHLTDELARSRPYRG